MSIQLWNLWTRCLGGLCGLMGGEDLGVQYVLAVDSRAALLEEVRCP